MITNEIHGDYKTRKSLSKQFHVQQQGRPTIPNVSKVSAYYDSWENQGKDEQVQFFS